MMLKGKEYWFSLQLAGVELQKVEKPITQM